jgi:hypothetical protein
MSFFEKLKYAFSIPKEEEKLTQDEEELLNKLAYEIMRRRLEVIAITFLESVKPLSFIGSQVMLFFQPIVNTIFPTKIYGKLQKILEKRVGIEYLLQVIEKK